MNKKNNKQYSQFREAILNESLINSTITYKTYLGNDGQNIRIHNNKFDQNNKQQQVVNIVTKFQPFKIPPSLNQALIHRAATQFGKNKNQYSFYSNTYRQPNQNQNKNNHDRNQVNYLFFIRLQSQKTQKNNEKQQFQKNQLLQINPRFCQCCGQQQKQILPLCCAVKQIYNVNQSLGYFFTYIKVICVLLFVIVISVGIYSFYQIIKNCNQEQQNCAIIYGIPISKFHLFFTDILIIMNVIILVVIYFFSGYLYYRNANIHRKLIMNHKKPSDFCVLLSGIDHQKVTGQSIKQCFHQYQIQDILYTHKIRKYIKKLALKSTLTAKKNLYYRKGQNQKCLKIQNKIKKIDDHVLHIKNKFNLGQQLYLRTDKIIIKFKTVQQKKLFESQFKQQMYQTIFHTFCGGSLIKINDNRIYVEPLGQPHQMVWENLQLKSKERYIRVFLANIITIVILGISYLLVALCTKIQKNQQGTGDIILSVIFSIVIEAINFLLDFTINKLTKWEKRYTLTGKINTILLKNSIAFFLNTTLIPFSLFLFAWGNSDQDDLIRNIFTLFLISNFISPFVSIYLQPQYFLKLYQRRKIKIQGNQCLQTQMKANSYFQKIDFQLNTQYSLVIQKIVNCMFYAAVFPLGIIITFLGLILTYWTSKYWLVKYCSIPKYSHKLGKLVVNISQFMKKQSLERYYCNISLYIFIRICCKFIYGT